MHVTRRSMLTGQVHTLDLHVSADALAAYEAGGILLQDAFPSLPPPEREFIKTGITPAEWLELFGPGPDSG